MKLNALVAAINGSSLVLATGWMVITLLGGGSVPPEIGLLYGFCGVLTLLNLHSVWKARKS